MILKMTTKIKSMHDGLSGFYNMWDHLSIYAEMRSAKVLHSRFSNFRIEIAYNKEIVVYFHLFMQYFSENIQMICDKILIRVIGTTQ